MKLFKKENHRNIVIVGCGRLGSALASNLSDQNENVLIVDCNEESLETLPQTYGGFSLEGDGTDTDILKLAGIQKADILIAATGDDNTNIMIAQIAKECFGVKTVVARVDDTSSDAVCSPIGIMAISPALLLFNEFKKVLGENEEST